MMCSGSLIRQAQRRTQCAAARFGQFAPPCAPRPHARRRGGKPRAANRRERRPASRAVSQAGRLLMFRYSLCGAWRAWLAA